MQQSHHKHDQGRHDDDGRQGQRPWEGSVYHVRHDGCLQRGWPQLAKPTAPLKFDRSTLTAAGASTRAEGPRGRGQARYSRSNWARLGCRSLASVLDSIWRIRSLVTPNSRPTSSSVRG